MKTLQEFYTDAWRVKIGMKPVYKPKTDIDLDELYKTQWSNEFEQYMRNRLVMGCLRYGDIRSGNYEYVGYLEYKLNKYQETGNLELLVDVANLALLEFINSKHPLKNWSPLDNENHAEKNQPKDI